VIVDNASAAQAATTGKLPMCYTVKQVAAMSGVSIRTLHFYDETGLLKPAYQGANSYRIYEEPQLVKLQQILFYRELGFELKQIKQILSRDDFEVLAALKSHREFLETKFARMRTLVETVDKTIKHLQGTELMTNEEMFAGFSVAAGKDRFEERTRLGGREPHDCKISSQDTAGGMCVFEFTGSSCGPKHSHPDLDEWIYILDGEVDFTVGEKRFLATRGETVFLPRNIPHAWAAAGSQPAKGLNTYQPAGQMEGFFRAIGKYAGGPAIHEVLTLDELRKLFADHGMELLGPPMVGEWNVDDQGRISRIA
jgi:DNA-binding transcriptional MerR regulator/quercetin dioxygenase-like cupin family protein